MEAIQKHEGSVLPLNRSNIDTDQIIPKQFLKRVERTGFGQFLFYNWRYDDAGEERADFNLNKAQFAGTSILIAGENFGCGSSREHAPWSLLDYGFKVIIAPSFADIFYNNALKNGIIPVQMNADQVNEWMEEAESSGLRLTVNLAKGQITDNEGKVISFSIDPYNKEKLMNGWDDIALTLKLEEQIHAYESKGV
ncbi:3-isopropylmalate dehydratase small subunit [Virgibacillus siamensis]|uniref:3-isopropylmalate dehydratase small subunit n=1 Tax=Virgibacillus siamensis TaxID=480071 RepID=UPI000986C210|nr:3-isopropylmalate dehydratase small subunit [Virgibacillus siamensis]